MKNILSILLLALSLGLSAQRFGTSASENNTGSQLTYAKTTTVDAAQAAIDTMYFQPNAWETIWSSTLSDSCVVKFSSTTSTYKTGDSFVIMLTKGSGNGRFRMGGSKYILSTANSTGVALAATKSCVMRFRYNGTKWIECERVVEP